MTTIAFDAMVVSGPDPDEGLFLVGFSDDQTEPSQYLLLQRSLQPADQDPAYGQDTYHVEWCGQEHSTYGGIEQFVLSSWGARVQFSPQGATALGGLSDLRIAFNLSPPELEALAEGLEIVFAGTGCLVRANA